jgi:hypothetical protein
MPYLQSSQLPIERLCRSQPRQKFRHQIPVMFGNCFVIQRLNCMQMIPGFDPGAPGGFSRNRFPFDSSLAFQFLRLKVPAFSLTQVFLSPGTEKLSRAPEVHTIAELYKVHDVAALGGAAETVKAARV